MSCMSFKTPRSGPLCTTFTHKSQWNRASLHLLIRTHFFVKKMWHLKPRPTLLVTTGHPWHLWIPTTTDLEHHKVQYFNYWKYGVIGNRRLFLTTVLYRRSTQYGSTRIYRSPSYYRRQSIKTSIWCRSLYVAFFIRKPRQLFNTEVSSIACDKQLWRRNQ